MAEIIISEFMDEAAVADLSGAFDVRYDPTLVDDLSELRDALADTRALIVRNRTQVRDELLESGPRLEAVGRLGVGLDNIDLDACNARHIAVYPASGANDLSVAEYVVTAALMLLRGAYASTARVVAGEWPRWRLIGRELSGKTLGLLGFGSIAREVAARARALGMIVAAHDPFVSAQDPAWNGVLSLSLDELFATADVLSLHVPLTDLTRDLVSAEKLSRMKRDAVLINAARGGIVDQEALAMALKSGLLAGAALDVFDTEPVQHGEISYFDGIDNLILTPHVAGVTVESNVRVSALIADKVRQHLTR